jgi:hypothetical protein
MLTTEPAGAVLADTMTISSIKFGGLKLAVAASLMAGALLIGPASRAAGEDAGAQVKPVLAQTLPNVPGKSLTAVIVTYAPGGKSVKHHHAGSAFVFVLSGAVQSERSATGLSKSTRPARASSSHPAANIWSARMRAPPSRRACSRSLSPMTAHS